ncbi:hypothetical protein ACFVRU_24540 [Streptomyces sp. NPDC057927]
MGSLFEAIEAEEAEVRGRVEQLEAQLAELTERLEAERERLSRLVITRETAGELLARMTDDSAVDEPVRQAPSAGDGSPFATNANGSTHPRAGHIQTDRLIHDLHPRRVAPY